MTAIKSHLLALQTTPLWSLPTEYWPVRTMLNHRLDAQLASSVALLLFWVKTVKYLQWFKGFRVLGRTIGHAMKPLTYFVVIVIMMMSGFTFFFYFTFGAGEVIEEEC